MVTRAVRVSLNTHDYDAKWGDEMKNVFQADDQFFAGLIPDMDPIDYVQLASHAQGIKNTASSFREQLLSGAGGNHDESNNVNAKEILERMERALLHRIRLEEKIPNMSIVELDFVKNLYRLPITRAPIPADDEDDIAYLRVVDDSHVPKNVREANLSLIDNLVEQLADISGGACPQGRTTRIFQVLRSLY